MSNKINSIFYFPESLTFESYLSLLRSGSIADRTIVFAEAQQAIYKNGVQYGIADVDTLKRLIEEVLRDPSIIEQIENIFKNSLDPDLINKIKAIIAEYLRENPAYDDEWIREEFAKIKRDGQSSEYITDASVNNQTLKLTKKNGNVITYEGGSSTLAGLDDVQISDPTNRQALVYNTLINKWVNGSAGGSGEGGNGGSAYDDPAIQSALQQLNNAITSLNNTADAESARLDSLIDNIDSEVSTRVNQLINDAQWIQEHFPLGVVTPNPFNNFGQQDVKQYLQELGVWAIDGDVTKTNWTNIVQDVNGLTGSVNQLLSDGIDQEALQAAIQLKIDEVIAGLDLSTMYAKKDAENVIEWMYSALKQQTGADKTFNEIVSAGKNGLSSAISDIRTYVGKLENGDYVATANIEAKVDEAIAGLKSSATSNNAKTEIFNKISKNSEDIAGILSEIAPGSANTSIVTRIQNWKSGLLTSANLEGATASLISSNQNNSVKSAIQTLVSDNISEAQLVTENDLTAAYIVAKVNGAASNINISADKIRIDGNTTLTGKLTALEGLITSSVETNTLHAYSGSSATASGGHVVIENGKIEGYTGTPSSKTNRYAFNADGSGQVANGNISWDANGNVIFNKNNVKIDGDLTIVEILNCVTYQLNGGGLGNDIYSGIGTHITYRIMKNGFVVKTGYVENVSNLTNMLVSRKYIGKLIATYYANPSAAGETRYEVYCSEIDGFSKESVYNWLRSLSSAVWQDMFKENNSYLIEEGTNVLFVVPTSESFILLNAFSPELLLDSEDEMNIVYNYLNGNTSYEADFYDLKLNKAFAQLQEEIQNGVRISDSDTGYSSLRGKTVEELYGSMDITDFYGYIQNYRNNPRYTDSTHSEHGYYLWKGVLSPEYAEGRVTDNNINVVEDLTITWPANK